jgi:hypothetical protein
MFKDIRGEFLSDEKLVQNVCVCVCVVSFGCAKYEVFKK